MLTEAKTKRARSSNSFVSVIISWLERMVLSKTFETDSIELEQDITGVSNVRIIGTVNNKVLLTCHGEKGKVKDCQ